jgi:hypothetical protein
MQVIVLRFLLACYEHRDLLSRVRTRPEGVSVGACEVLHLLGQFLDLLRLLYQRERQSVRRIRLLDFVFQFGSQLIQFLYVIVDLLLVLLQNIFGVRLGQVIRRSQLLVRSSVTLLISGFRRDGHSSLPVSDTRAGKQTQWYAECYGNDRC